MSTLARYGYAEKDELTRRFHLGPQVVSLSRSLLTRLPLREAAKPYLRQLMERTGECAHLAVAAQGKVLYIDQVESPATLRVNAQVGTLNPLHCTALGKVLLAFGGSGPALQPGGLHPPHHHRPGTPCAAPWTRSAAWATPSMTRSSIPACAASPCRSSISAARRLARSASPALPPALTPERLPELAATCARNW